MNKIKINKKKTLEYIYINDSNLYLIDLNEFEKTKKYYSNYFIIISGINNIYNENFVLSIEKYFMDNNIGYKKMLEGSIENNYALINDIVFVVPYNQNKKEFFKLINIICNKFNLNYRLKIKNDKKYFGKQMPSNISLKFKENFDIKTGCHLPKEILPFIKELFEYKKIIKEIIKVRKDVSLKEIYNYINEPKNPYFRLKFYDETFNKEKLIKYIINNDDYLDLKNDKLILYNFPKYIYK